MPLNSTRILLIEDSPWDVRLVKEAFKECGLSHELLVASDGVEAMDMLHRKGAYASAPRPELILLDLNLPRKNGREVLHEIKSDPELKHIPVVVLTTSKAREDIEAVYNLHANSYVAKPTQAGEFFEMISKLEQYWFRWCRLP